MREGIDALGMDQEEALQDAIKAFQLRGADLSRVRKTVPPSEGRAELRAKGLARELKSGVESGVLAGMKDGIRRLRSELVGLTSHRTPAWRVHASDRHLCWGSARRPGATLRKAPRRGPGRKGWWKALSPPASG